ncbi:ABC transporter ATP-binding protein [Bacillus sp. M6-12]|uniref:ABC transporter ATP-binding protein n=1 Tax=Bacillus sp. M6-12 TaxID=2054166 RepID=UPI00269B10DE|nr:ABC transporter ATP-binding protein [Bacillus sp. M6-12]
MLTINNVDASYSKINVLKNVSLQVQKGEVVSFLGANGAGKTTTLKTITGGVTITHGSIVFEGKDITHLPPHKVVQLGIAHVPEGRRVFKNMSVEDNLLLGGVNFLKGNQIKEQVELVYEYFPRLLERKTQLAGTLSGGEQQMLAIGRGLIMKPKLLILDEPSQGLAPIIIEEIFNTIRNLSKTGLTILLVEQNIYQALSISDRGYVLKNGKIIMEDESEALLNDKNIRESYLH